MFGVFYPKLYVPSLADVDVNALVKQGIKAVLLDLDNTMLPWKDKTVPSSTAEWVKQAVGAGLKLCIASNTHNPKRLRAIADELGILCLDRIAKPRRKGLMEAMEALGSEPVTTAMIGDQIFTDILGGNRLGLLTILVQPMHSREFFGTKISRLFEIPVLAALKRHGMIPSKPAGSPE